MDDLVDIILGYYEPLEEMGALKSLPAVVARPSDYDLLLEGEILSQHLAEIQYLRLSLVIYEGEHYYGKRRLHLGLSEEPVQHDLRVSVALELDDDAHSVSVGLVAQVGYAIEALVVYLVLYILYEHALVYLIRQLVYYYPRSLVLAELLELGSGSHDYPAPSGGVGLADAVSAHDYALRREIGAGDMLHKVGNGRLRVIKEADGGVYHLAQVMRRNVRRHTDGDSR